MKRKIEFSSVVAETLLIPLYMRAKESKRGENAILKDGYAEKLISEIDYDYSKFAGASLSANGCIIRGWYFDNAVRRFIDSHEHPVVVNVGCGLDTRAQRIGSTKAVFYELDLPEVIELRRQFIPETGNDRYLAESLVEKGWVEQLRRSHPDGRFIFVVEGVLMFLREEEVKGFVKTIADNFAGGELWFDLCGTMFMKKNLKPDSLNSSEAQIRFGLNDAKAVESWTPGVELMEQEVYMHFFRRRWGFFLGQILGRSARLCRKFSSLAGFRLTGAEAPERHNQ